MVDKNTRPKTEDLSTTEFNASKITSILIAVSMIVVALLLILSLSGCEEGGGSSANRTPTIGGVPVVSTRAGETFSFMPVAQDPDGDVLIFKIVNEPAWASFDSETGRLSGFPETADLGEDEDIVITVSDGKMTAKLSPFNLVVLPQPLNRSNFATDGDMFETENGYQSVGKLSIMTGERTQEFENSDLTLEFDAEGSLIALSGMTTVPKNPTEDVRIDSDVDADVVMMTGAEINADERFEIELNEDGHFLVFYIDGSLEMTITSGDDPNESEQITLNSPLDTKIILITDPSDPFLYWFGSQAVLGEYGYGSSYSGLIPFSPDLESPDLDSFRGHELEQGVIGLGVKIFDFFEISGMRVVKLPLVGEIDWEDPLHSNADFKAGFNGDADFSFSVLGVGLFSFDVAQTSATIDVGLDRQHLAMQTRVGPDFSWVPEWFHFEPMTETNASWSFDGNGDYLVELDASFRSDTPPADVAGMMTLENGVATLVAQTIGDGERLEVSISFGDEITEGRIRFPESFAESIVADVEESVERGFAMGEQAIRDLKQASDDYEFEASLRGLRALIPGIVNPAVTELNRLPDQVGQLAYDGTIREMATRCVNIFLLGRICVDDLADAPYRARRSRDRARNQTQAAVTSAVSRLINLRNVAAQGDDEMLRDALRTALITAYDNRVFSVRVRVTQSFDFTVYNYGTVTLYDQTHTRTLFDSATANRIRLAANNVNLIPLTSDILIKARQVVDELPIDETLEAVKQQIADGIATIPTPEGLGYRAIGDSYEAFVTIEGVDHVIEINVLSPSEVQVGVSDFLRDLLIGDL